MSDPIDYNNLTPEQHQVLKKEAFIISEQHPNHIPLIITTLHKNTVHIDKNKMLVNGDITIEQLIMSLNKKLKIDKNHTIFLKINEVVLEKTLPLTEVYNQFMDPQNHMLMIQVHRTTNLVRKAFSFLTFNYI